MTRRIEYGPSVDIDFGNNKLTNLADGVAADDAATVGQIPASGVPTSRTLTAGAALTGGGDLTANRTFDVAVDGSTIEVSSDALRVKADGITANEIAAGAVGASELASTAVTPGTYGDASNVPQVTVDADGRITAASNVAITGGGGGGSGTPLDGWVDDTAETWTYASGSGGGTATFTVSGDKTAQYTTGTRIKLTQTTAKYFVVISSAHAAGTTTVTITAGSDYTLANAAISANYHSYAENPQGYPGWFAFTSGLTGTSAISINLARFAVVGRTCFFALTLSWTSNATTKTITLPITPRTIASMQWIVPLTVANGGTAQTSPGEIVIDSNDLTADLYRNSAAAAWTASGTGFAVGNGYYEI